MTNDGHYIHAAVSREDYLFRLRDTERFRLHDSDGDVAQVDFNWLRNALTQTGWRTFSTVWDFGFGSGLRACKFFRDSLGHPSIIVHGDEASRTNIEIKPPRGSADLTLGEIIFETAIGRGYQPVAFFNDPADRIASNAQLHILPAPASGLPTVPSLAVAPSIEAVELSLLRFSDHRIEDDPSSELERLQVDDIELQRLINHLTNPNGDATNRQGNIADQLPDIPSFARYGVIYPSSDSRRFEIRIPDRIKGLLVTLDLPGHSSLTRILDTIASEAMNRLPANMVWYWSAQNQITLSTRS